MTVFQFMLIVYLHMQSSTTFISLLDTLHLITSGAVTFEALRIFLLAYDKRNTSK